MPRPEVVSLQDWPRMAQAVNDDAAGLHAEYGEQGVPSDVLKREIERISGYSVIPSDYCFNVINRAAYLFRHLVLKRVGRGSYKYVGPDDAFTGPIMWKPKQEAERQVESWSDGVCDLNFDPRA